MNLHSLAALCLLILASCASRTPFSPDGPTTVGMPAKLSDRERIFIPTVESALRREGLVPVGSGRGDLQLDFSMAAGPINIDTKLALTEDGSTLVSGFGRAAGAPLIGRSGVAEKSFDRAFQEFDAGLSGMAASRGWAAQFGGSTQPDHPATDYSEENLPVY